jgi:hypothetical protein
MRAYDLGCFVRVTCDQWDVAAFNAQWPCSSIPERSVGFTFDKRNGDLVDLSPDGIDGPEVVALSEAAQNYAAKRLKLDSLKR